MPVSNSLKALPISFIAFIAFVLVAFMGCSVSELPSRSDCIVRADIKSPGRSKLEEAKLLRITPSAREHGIPLGGWRVSGSTVYFQYQRQCAQRVAFTQRLISHVGLPLAAPLKTEKITPSLDTVEIKGRAWRD